MEINNLTEHQIDLLNAMWECDSLEELEEYIATLSPEDSVECERLQRMVLISALDDDLATQTEFPDAMRELSRFM